jgi:hypothetical protein
MLSGEIRTCGYNLRLQPAIDKLWNGERPAVQDRAQDLNVRIAQAF